MTIDYQTIEGVFEFEQEWPNGLTDAKEAAIRDRFGVTHQVYYQLLYSAAETDHARHLFPDVAARARDIGPGPWKTKEDALQDLADYLDEIREQREAREAAAALVSEAPDEWA